MNMANPMENNKAVKMLKAAEEGGYGVIGVVSVCSAPHTKSSLKDTQTNVIYDSITWKPLRPWSGLLKPNAVLLKSYSFPGHCIIHLSSSTLLRQLALQRKSPLPFTWTMHRAKRKSCK